MTKHEGLYQLLPCAAWPCVTCAAVDWCDAAEKCSGGYTCAADDERMREYERQLPLSPASLLLYRVPQ